MLRIELLGSPAVHRGSGDAPGPRDRKTWGLLAFLLLADAPPSRQRLAELLFPEANDPLAGVRWNLAQLRRLLGDDARAEGDPVRLQLPDAATVDVEVLTRGRWSEALTLPLERELLEGMAFGSAPAFELWLTGARRRVRATSASVLHEATLATLARDPGAAVGIAQRLVDVDPFDENHHAAVVRALATAGRAAEASAHVDDATAFLERELGVVPSPGLRDALAVAPAPSAWTVTPASVRARLEAGQAATAAGSWTDGIEHLRGALGDARHLADAELLARCLVALGSALVHAARGHDEEAAASLHEGGAVAEANGHDAVAATAWRELAWIEVLRARHDRADRWLDRARAAAGEDPLERAWTRLIAGVAQTDLGDHARAEDELRGAVDVAEAAGLPGPAAFARSFLGRLHLLRGELDEAEDVLRRSVDGARAMGWTSMVPWPEALLAEVLLRRGDTAGATDLFEHAFTMGRQIGDPCWESMGARGLGLVAIRSGDLDRGVELLEQAPRTCRRLPDSYVWIEAYALEALCDVAVEHDLPSASRWIAELEGLASRSGFRELSTLALHHRARRHEAGAAEAARATAEALANAELLRRLGGAAAP